MRDEDAFGPLPEEKGEGVERAGGAHPGEPVGPQVQLWPELVAPALADERIGRRALAQKLSEVTLERLRLLVLFGPFARLEAAARRVGQRLLVTQARIRLPGLAALAQLLSELADRSRGASSLL